MINASVCSSFFISFFFIVAGNATVATGAGEKGMRDSLSHYIALEFDSSDLLQLDDPDFKKLEDGDIRLIKVRGTINEPVASFLQNRSYRYFFSTDLRYLISTGDSRTDSLYLSDLIRDYTFLESSLPGQVAGYGIAVFPHVRDTDTIQLLSEFSAQVRSTGSELIPIYITIPMIEQETPLPGNIDFVNFVVPPFDSHSFLSNQLYSLKLSDDEHRNYTDLQNILEKSSEVSNSVVVLDGSWVIQEMDKSDKMEIILTNYQQDGSVTIPLPASDGKQMALNPAALILLLLLVTYILHYKYQPMYRHSLGRFFFNHNFFVDDVIEHRIHLTTPGLILLGQHILLSGLIFFVVAHTLFSDRGLDSFFYHYSLFSFLPVSYFSFFFIGVIFSALSKILSILWLHLLNRKLQYIDQVLTFYTWPLQANLLVVIFVVIGFNTGISEIWMVSLLFLFLIIWFMSFNIAAIDGAKALEAKGVFYLIATAGMNTLFGTLLVAAIFMIPAIIKPLQLAYYLP